jgi:hypothetical protein
MREWWWEHYMLDFPHAMGRCDQMPIIAIIALLALAFPRNAWAIRSASTAGPSVAHVDRTDGKHTKCLKQSKELNGNCRKYEIRK